MERARVGVREIVSPSVRQLVVLVALAVPIGSAGPTGIGGPGALAAQTCDGVMIGDLGIRRLSCDCTVAWFDDSPSWEFRSLPRVVDIAGEGPAAGRLATGDVLVTIDGADLQSAAGARRFSSVEPGESVTFGIDRAGARRTVEVVAGSICSTSNDVLGRAAPAVSAPEAPGAPQPPSGVAGAPRTVAGSGTPRPASIAGARVPEPPQGAATLVPEPPGARPAGWFGFALACSGCGWAREAGDENARWESREPPVIRSVEPGGPADVAGLRRGDRIAAIDGLSITSREGGSRLGSARPGERVVLEVERDGSTVRADVTIATRPTPRAPGAPEPTAAPGTGASPTPPPAGQPAPAPVAPPEPVLRYEGRLGDVRIEVSGQPVVVLESGDELELLIGGTRVRLRLDPSDR